MPVQRVHAIGKPPDGKLCLFRHIKNAVVFATKGASIRGMQIQSNRELFAGDRPLPDCLSGGDLDG